MNTIFATPDLIEVQPSNTQAEFKFEHIEDYGNGYLVRPFRKGPRSTWIRLPDFIVRSQARTAARVLNEYVFLNNAAA